MRALDYSDLGAIRHKHPHRNFQASPCCFDDRDRAISPLRPANDLKSGAMERMEWVEDLDVLGFCAQGIVSVDGIIHMSTASFRPAASPPIIPIGSTHRPGSFSRYACSVKCSAENSWRD
jgi:hypothetical protein